MTLRRSLALWLVIVAAVAWVAACGPKSDLADDAPATPCEVCHAEIELGFKKTKHASQGHTCVTCHGRSARHSWSEDGHVKPDRPLRQRGPADKLCITCHEKVEHPAGLSLDRKCIACHRPHPKKETFDPDAIRPDAMP